jgi:dihydrolipoamide dehydrogenase
VLPEPWKAFGDRLLTTDTIFEQEDLPRRMAVVGMGAVGVELAQALARLGIEVTGFDAVEELAGIDDPAVLEACRSQLEREMDLRLGAAADLEAAGDAIRITGAGGGVEVDAVLAALGRRPNIEGLGLENLGVDLDDRGMPAIDPGTLQIGELDIFLAGDANGYRPLLHEAADEGYIAGRNAAPDGDRRPRCRRTPLNIVFTSPQVARVGPPYSSMEASRLASASADFSSQARARMAGEAAGVLRIHAKRDSGVLVGAELCTPAAEHLAHLLALAVERELTVSDMLAMPFYHPVLEEGLRGALRSLARELPAAGGSDLSACDDIGQEALD